jgi:hypothetical protein
MATSMQVEIRPRKLVLKIKLFRIMLTSFAVEGGINNLLISLTLDFSQVTQR